MNNTSRGGLRLRFDAVQRSCRSVHSALTGYVATDTNVPPTPAGPDQAFEHSLTSACHDLSRFGVTVPPRSDVFAYFKFLDDVMRKLGRSGATETVDAVMTHVNYVADQANCRSEEILSGQHFTAASPVVLDALCNIGVTLRASLWTLPELPPEGIPEDVFGLILQAEAKLVGWCSREKALMIARTVLQERPQTCVEIGVFGGRSLVPCAAALRHNGAGVIYGIEAWSPSAAIENATNEANDEWWSTVDFRHIKQEFYRFVAANELTWQVRVIEAPSGRAASLFDKIDFLHIDGSHSTVNAAEDVILYARKVRSGGIVVFDDVNWRSTAPARELLGAFCDTVMTLKHEETGQDMCAVLRRH